MKTFKEFNSINESKINEDSNFLQGVKEYRDGLTPEIIQKDYPWLLKAKIKDAVIGEDKRGLVWYDGIWEKGIWEDGDWEYGEWYDGTWEKGTWKDGDWYGGTWKNGNWLDGTWNKGTWIDGTWENGTFKKGTWKDGTWKEGIWKDGTNLHIQ